MVTVFMMVMVMVLMKGLWGVRMWEGINFTFNQIVD